MDGPVRRDRACVVEELLVGGLPGAVMGRYVVPGTAVPPVFSWSRSRPGLVQGVVPAERRTALHGDAFAFKAQPDGSPCVG